MTDIRSQSRDMVIGFIGLGDMGRPLALRLLRAGFSLVVCDRNPVVVEEFFAAGAVAVTTPREVASQAPLVITCLPTPDICREVAYGEGGLIEGTAIRWHVELSTAGYPCMRDLAENLGAKGIEVLDAPVSGGPRGEARGRLICFVAASQDAFDHARPVLTALSDKLFHVGHVPGQSQVLKLANNLLGAANLAIASEMVNMARKAGIEPQTAIDVMNVSTGRNRATEEIFESEILSGNFGLGAKLSILQKDVSLAIREADRLGVTHTASDGVRSVWEAAVAAGHGSEDLSRIYEFIVRTSIPPERDKAQEIPAHEN